MPTVSVITATYKGAPFIGETIESVLAQTFADWEMIVVDDRSPDDTLAVLARYTDPRIRVVASPVNERQVRTRNKAFALATGKYVAGLDHDDLCLPDRFARQVAFLDANPDFVAVGSNTRLLEDGETRPSPLPQAMPPLLVDWLLGLVNPLGWSSMMIRGEAARRLNPFTRPELLLAEDFDLYHRLRRLGPIGRIDEPLLLYRVIATGESKVQRERMIAQAARVLAEAHRPVFRGEADEVAELIARHIGAGEPVRDREMLARLDAVIATLQAEFFAARALDEDERELIVRETSHLWWKIVRTSVRLGFLPVADAIAAKPAAARLSESRAGDLLLSGLIGTARALARGRG